MEIVRVGQDSGTENTKRVLSDDTWRRCIEGSLARGVETSPGDIIRMYPEDVDSKFFDFVSHGLGELVDESLGCAVNG